MDTGFAPHGFTMTECDMDTDFARHGLTITESNDASDDDLDIAERAFMTLEWRVRCGGHVAHAWLGDKAVAGVSGPWEGKFALTWWDRPLPARRLELHDSLEDAKREVEVWLQRMRKGKVSVVPAAATAVAPPAASVARPNAPTAPTGFFAHLRSRWLGATSSPARTIDRLRRDNGAQTPDLGGLHFGALDL